MKKYIPLVAICLIASRNLYSMDSIDQKVDRFERHLVTQSSQKPADTIIDDLKAFLEDQTLSSSSSLMFKTKLVDKLSTYIMKRHTVRIPSDDERVYTELESTHFVDKTYSVIEIKWFPPFDKNERKTLAEKARSPWHELPLDTIIKQFLIYLKNH